MGHLVSRANAAFQMSNLLGLQGAASFSLPRLCGLPSFPTVYRHSKEHYQVLARVMTWERRRLRPAANDAPGTEYQ